MQKDNKLFLYCGYNQIKDGILQHSGTVFSEYEGETWSEMQSIMHDVPHIIWLWKIRKYKEKYYGVGYLEGEKPVLLSSNDGVNWNTLALLHVESVCSEADLNFVNDSSFGFRNQAA